MRLLLYILAFFTLSAAAQRGGMGVGGFGHSRGVITGGNAAAPADPGATLASFPAPASLQGAPGDPAPGSDFNLTAANGSVGIGAPVIGTASQVAYRDRHITITGDNLSGAIWWVHDGSKLLQASVPIDADGSAAQDNQVAIALLPQALNTYGTYVLWAQNANGKSAPMVLSRTRITAMQSKGKAGDVIWLNGVNLTAGNVENGLTNIFIRNTSTGVGQWVPQSYITVKEPLHLEFRVPDGGAGSTACGDGNYEVWVHRGDGKGFGWSNGASLSVEDMPQSRSWTHAATVFPSGLASDAANINAAIAAASFGQYVQLGAGTFWLNASINWKSGVQLRGTVSNGTKQTFVKVGQAFSGPNGLWNIPGGASTIVIRDLVLDQNGLSTGTAGDFARFMHVTGNKIVLDNLEIIAENTSDYSSISRGFTAIEIGNAEHIYMIGCSVTGGSYGFGHVVFMESVRQFVIQNSIFKMTRDCSAAFVTKYTSEFCFRYNTIQDKNSSALDGSGTGKGRIWSSKGNGGAQYGANFSHNTGVNLGPRNYGTNLPDPNSGEVFLVEGNYARALVKPTGIPASNRLTFSTAVPTTSADAVAGRKMSVMIIKGKGMGQTANIVGYENGNTTIVLDRPLLVQPATSGAANESTVWIGPMTYDYHFYNNSITAKPHINDSQAGSSHTASCGINMYGGWCNNIAWKNTFDGTRVGVALWGFQNSAAVVDPSYNNDIRDNNLIRNVWGIQAWAQPGPGNNVDNPMGYTGLIGNRITDNKITETVGTDEGVIASAIYLVYWSDLTGEPPAVNGIVWDGNNMVTNIKNWYRHQSQTGTTATMPAGRVVKDVFYKNY